MKSRASRFSTGLAIFSLVLPVISVSFSIFYIRISNPFFWDTIKSGNWLIGSTTAIDQLVICTIISMFGFAFGLLINAYNIHVQGRRSLINWLSTLINGLPLITLAYFFFISKTSK